MTWDPSVAWEPEELEAWAKATEIGPKEAALILNTCGILFPATHKRTAPPGSLQQKVIDTMALIGDASDNVPGAPGIGKVIAGRLIDRWGSLDAVMVSAMTGYTDRVLTPRIAKIIVDNWKQIIMSRELVRLDWQ